MTLLPPGVKVHLALGVRRPQSLPLVAVRPIALGRAKTISLRAPMVVRSAGPLLTHC
jgi:hypothetical protein